VEGWEQALAGLARGRGAALKRHAFLLCGDEDQADDLVQEALVRAFTRPLRVLRPGAAEAYVRVIMLNLFIDGVRRHSRWSRVAPLLRPAGMAPDPADQVSDRDAMLTAPPPGPSRPCRSCHRSRGGWRRPAIRRSWTRPGRNRSRAGRPASARRTRCGTLLPRLPGLRS
jgi:Sigma-70 region 2